MLSSIKPRTSARDLVAPVSPPAEAQAPKVTARRDNLTNAEFHEAYLRLRDLRQNWRSRALDDDDLGRNMIAACIAEGIDTWPRIRGTLRKFRLNTDKLENIMLKHSGDDPDVHWWQQQADDTFRLHDAP